VLRISKVSSVANRLGQKNANEFYGTGFIYGTGDTICAARAGTVYECSDEIKEGEKGNEVYHSNRNRVRIQHKDGTLSHYSIRAPIKLLVAEGDYVVPGQPIAVFNKESERYEVLFSVEYLDEKRVMAGNTSDASANLVYYFSLPTVFCVNEDGQTNPLTVMNQTFKISHPKQFIGLELSKKQKKKLGLQ